MPVILGPGPAHGYELADVGIGQFLGAYRGRGHGEFPETGHGMEEQGLLVSDIQWGQGQSKDPIGPVELQTVEVVFGVERVRIEEVMGDSEGSVVQIVVDHQTESEDVGDVGNCAFALALPGVHYYVCE